MAVANCSGDKTIRRIRMSGPWDGLDGRRDWDTVVVVVRDALFAIVDDERHREYDGRIECPFGGDRARVCPRGEASAGMINTEIPEKREANGAEPEIYMHRTNRVHYSQVYSSDLN